MEKMGKKFRNQGGGKYLIFSNHSSKMFQPNIKGMCACYPKFVGQKKHYLAKKYLKKGYDFLLLVFFSCKLSKTCKSREIIPKNIYPYLLWLLCLGGEKAIGPDADLGPYKWLSWDEVKIDLEETGFQFEEETPSFDTSNISNFPSLTVKEENLQGKLTLSCL